MRVKDTRGAASGTTMSLPERHGSVAFDSEGVAHEINEAQAKFLIETFPDQFVEYHEPPDQKERGYTGDVTLNLKTKDGVPVEQQKVHIANGLGVLELPDVPRPSQSMGTVEKEEALQAALHNANSELAQALSANVRLERENAELRVQAFEADEAAKKKGEKQPEKQPEPKPTEPAPTAAAPPKK